MIKNKAVPSGKKRWNEIFDLDNSTWDKIYKLPFSITTNTKLQWFQYRINHHVLTTNSFLFKAHLAITPLCTLCNSETETVIHILWECQEVQRLLNSFEILLDALIIPFHFNNESFLFGFLTPNVRISKVDNEILIIIKHYIYKIRCFQNSLNINALINTIKDYYCVQKYIATSKGDTAREKFLNDWKKWEKIVAL